MLRAGALALSWSDRTPAPGLDDPSIYAVGVGLFEHVEVHGRLVEGDLPPPEVDVRDLSAGLKVRLFRRPGWPSLAAGAQDIQGNQLFPTYYAVSSWSGFSFRLSAGYGWQSQLLDGAFGGLEWQPSAWFALLAEHTALADRAALRLTVPLPAGARLSGLAAVDVDTHEENFGAELALPLGGTPAARPAPRAAGAPAASLDDGLRRAGLVATAVTLTDDLLTVCVDDALQYRAPIDALGVAAALVAGRSAPTVSRIRTVLERDGRPFLAAADTRAALTAFFAQADAPPPAVQFAAPGECRPAGIARRASPRPIELVLEPDIVSFVGTEYGAADVDLSLRVRLQVPLFRGGMAVISALTPSVRSTDFDDGGPFEANRSRDGIDQGLLQWYVRPARAVHTLTSLGHMRVFGEDTVTLMQEHAVHSRDGRWSGRANLGLFRSDSDTVGVGIAEVGRHFAAHDTSLRLAAGQFAAGDTGARLELSRWFGDTSITVFAKAAGSGNDAAGGMRLALPLSWRMPGPRGRFVVRGAERWAYALQSTFGGRSGANYLRPNLLVEPLPDRNLRESYLDVDRATPEWIRAHADRLRDALPGALEALDSGGD